MAGLIPQNFIDDLLTRANIVDVIDKRVSLRKTGKNYTACCPFHNEKSPSFSVEPEKQFFYCFGCGEGGNALGFITKFDSVDFPQAVEILAQEYGLEVPREESPAQKKIAAKLEGIHDILAKSTKFYQEQLRSHTGRDAAVAYLKRRGVSGEIARDFCLGFAPEGWENLSSLCAKNPQEKENLVKAGLVLNRESKDNGKSTYDRFRNRIMFPIRDSRGRTIAFGGRVLGDEKPKYLNSPETPVFQKGNELYGLYEAKKNKASVEKFLIVEGYMDVIALAQMGIRNAVATLGTATSAQHLTKLFRLVPEVIFCFDGDSAGRKAAWRALETSLPQMEDGRQISFLFLPDNEDPDTVIRKVGQQAFSKLVDDATPLEEFLFNKLSSDLDLESFQDRGKLSKLAKPLLNQIPDGIFNLLVRKRLAEILGIELDALNTTISASAGKFEAKHYEAVSPNSSSNENDQATEQRRFKEKFTSKVSAERKFHKNPIVRKRESLELKAIELLLIEPTIALSVDGDFELLEHSKNDEAKVLFSLIKMIKNDPKISVTVLLGYCSGSEIKSSLSHRLNAERITPKEGLGPEFLEIYSNILSLNKKQVAQHEINEKLRARAAELDQI